MRCGIRVRGAVQGVGLRPAVYRLARAAGLAGFVRNDGGGVWIEVEGSAAEVDRFPARLRREAPPLARIEQVEVVRLEPTAERGFQVVASAAVGDTRAGIPADAATCDACLAELLDPRDRRFRYPFITCTDCGPRYTIVRELPYDRATTTMDRFRLCPACLAEYQDPDSRRYHAETNACPACGPRLRVLRASRGGALLAAEGALRVAARVLRTGGIVAVKGLGGFFLAVDARDDAAVRRLRSRKHRPDRPLALMARDLGEARRVASIDEAAAVALSSSARPIVLVPRRPGAGVAPAVAPGMGDLGVMLPYTPLHHLLLRDGPPLLVMTSGNPSGEPIIRTDAEAVERLGAVADLVLGHDREIHARADDSVVRMMAGAPTALRRARGAAPDPVPLIDHGPPVLAVGAEQKATVCLTRAGQAYLSPHLGDLSNLEAHGFFEESIVKLERLLGVRPEAVAHDLHPDYRSTRWALASGLRTVAVQHHHAHVASCLAEHGRAGPVLGVAFDGTGCGPAGEAWGGEVLLADLGGYRRLAHLRPIALPGGEAAIREPWRLACAALADAGEALDLVPVDAARRDLARRLVGRPGLAPPATGAGRWLDAVAALCGLRERVTYDGQAPAELEAVAAPGEHPPYPFLVARDAEGCDEADLRPAVRAIAADLRRGVGAAVVSARVHETLAAFVLETCRRAREALGHTTVALSGGCFQSRLLTERCLALLGGAGFEVLLHRAVPPSDGGVSLGQAAVASHRLVAGEG